MTAACAGLTISAGLACSAPARDRLARFFFEIPPDAKTPVEPPRADVEAHTQIAVGTIDIEGGVATVGSAHAPFVERACAKCHDAGDRMHVRDDVMDACRECHPGYFVKDITHPPVRKGQCDECHVPHRSVEPALLWRPLLDVCIECHEEPAKLSPVHHPPADVSRCTSCHDPHFGEGRRLHKGWPIKS